MEKRILIFEDDEIYVGGLKLFIDDLIAIQNLDLRFALDVCQNYCEAKDRLCELATEKNIHYYDLIVVDLKLPLAAKNLEAEIAEEFVGLELTKLIRETFSDEIRFLPVTAYLEDLKNLNPRLHDVDQTDIDHTIDKTNMAELALEILKMLTQQ